MLSDCFDFARIAGAQPGRRGQSAGGSLEKHALEAEECQLLLPVEVQAQRLRLSGHLSFVYQRL